MKGSFLFKILNYVAKCMILSNFSGPHKIQGIGAGFIPGVLDVDLVDEVIQVSFRKYCVLKVDV